MTEGECASFDLYKTECFSRTEDACPYNTSERMQGLTLRILLPSGILLPPSEMEVNKPSPVGSEAAER